MMPNLRFHSFDYGGFPMSMENTLLHRFGPLLSIAQLAAILDRSPDGLRIGLRTTNEWAQRISKARLKIGRRVYFRTRACGHLISE
jgi:hypothetical protein